MKIMKIESSKIALLRRNLQQELVLAKRWLVLSQQESDALIRNDVQQLDGLQEALQRCFAEQEALEQARQLTLREMATALGISSPIKLPALIQSLPARDRSELAALRSQLLAVHRRIEIVQACNQRLLDNALEYVRYSLELLTDEAIRLPRYGYNLTRISAPAFFIDSRA